MLPQGGDQAANCGDEEERALYPGTLFRADWWHAAWDENVPCIPERCSGADWWHAGLNETGKRDLLRVANRAAFAKHNLLLLDMG